MDNKKTLIRVHIAWCCLALHVRLFKDTHFIGPLELEANDPPKIPVVQALNNSINSFLINPNIILSCVFSLNIY